MNEQLLKWLKSNRNQTFESPRRTVFGTKAQRFEIMKVNKAKGIVEVEFKKRFTPLRLEFWRFETTLDLLEKNRGKWTRLGANFDSNDPNTIEYNIQTKARQIHSKRKIDYKSAPHVCDILVLYGMAEYGKTINPNTGRENQAIRLVEA